MAALEMSLLKIYIEHIAVRMGQGKKQTHVSTLLHRVAVSTVSFFNLTMSTFNHQTLQGRQWSFTIRRADLEHRSICSRAVKRAFLEIDLETSHMGRQSFTLGMSFHGGASWACKSSLLLLGLPPRLSI